MYIFKINLRKHRYLSAQFAGKRVFAVKKERMPLRFPVVVRFRTANLSERYGQDRAEDVRAAALETATLFAYHRRFRKMIHSLFMKYSYDIHRQIREDML